MKCKIEVSWNVFNGTFILLVAVNPKPFVSTRTEAICSGGTFATTPVNNLPDTTTIIPANTTYTWTVVDNPSVTLEYFFLDAFSFTSEYNFYHNRDKAKTFDTEYDFLTASLSYQKRDSKFEYKVSATNLLNTTALNDNSFNALGGSTSFTSFYVQPRFVVFSLKYVL